jgi:ATP-binding protein involved in chromosome partitioning
MTDSATIESIARRIAGLRVGGIRMGDTHVTLALEVGGLSPAAQDTLETDLRAAMTAAGVRELRVARTATRAAPVVAAPSAPAKRPLRIAVGSGKGGVGKSTLSANLAIALLALGRRTGMVDADIYGPSQPRLFDREDARPDALGDKLVPVMSAYGVPLLSMGQIAKPGQAIAWRGPMAGKALDQLVDAAWDDVEVLIIDLPPGTGDIQISMLQKFKPAGAVIVSTPQDLALIDATRAITLFRDAGVPIVGMVENMAGYICPHCGEASEPFGHGGAEAAAATMHMPFLGRVPLALDIRLASDAGVPPAVRRDALSEPYHAIAARIDRWITAHAQMHAEELNAA